MLLKASETAVIKNSQDQEETISIQKEELALSNEIESDIIGTRVRFYGRFRTIEDLEQLPITRLNNRVVRLNEIATVRQELEQEDTRAFISWQGGEYQPVVSVGVK